MSKRAEWPEKLKQPIIIARLAQGLFGKGDAVPDDAHTILCDRHLAERVRRALVIADFLGVDTEDPNCWYHLIVRMCEHWGIPGFEVVQEVPEPRRAGRSKTWTAQKHCELFADVMSLKANNRRMSEHAACIFIAKHPHEFGNRYRAPRGERKGAFGKTLHRQFIAAKRQVKNNILFRISCFGISGAGLFQPVPEYGEEFVRLAIERYAFARKSVSAHSA